MVQEACGYVEKTPNLDTKLKLLDTLRTVTAGKVFQYMLHVVYNRAASRKIRIGLEMNFSSLIAMVTIVLYMLRFCFGLTQIFFGNGDQLTPCSH